MRTMTEAARGLASGAVSSRSLIEAALERIAAPGGEGASTFLRVYADEARASADAMDALRRARRAPGDFAGIPVSLKDLLDVAGETTAAASAVLADAPPAPRHATVVQRILSAGLIPIGRTNMTEFAFSGVGINPHHGTPRAPFDRATSDRKIGRVSGGSSSGAAVSVADFMAFAAVGTDTGGSCRIPAAFCGVTGFKPTAIRVPRDGVLPLSTTLDSVGPLARSVACCAIMDGVMAGDVPSPLAVIPPAGLRLLMPTNGVLDGMDAPTERALDWAVRRLDRAGVVIHHRPLAAFDRIGEAHLHGGFAVVESFTWHELLLARSAGTYDPRVAGRMAPGGEMKATAYIRLLEARARIIVAFTSEMAPYDALIMPTVPIAPPPITAFDDEVQYRALNALILRNPSQINFVDGCAISLPCHEPGAPPAGLTVALPAMNDRRLLALAASLETIIAPYGNSIAA